LKKNGSVKPLQEKPPLPVSTSTKNKLSAFQFSGQNNADKPSKQSVIKLRSDEEKENGKLTAMEPLLEADSKSTTTSMALAAEQPSNSFPSTPAGRLALPDLIGMGDVQRAVQDISPEERIEWDLRSSSSQFGIKRAKKRARSSSPFSSPAAQASAHFNSRGESLNTQIDSGSELWGRYSLNGSAAPTPHGAIIPALANIMFTSSPQNSRENTPRSGMFRRTNSCGNSFPKRRRIAGSQKDDVFSESANIGPSKLSVLIERVQEGLSKPVATPKKQISSHRIKVHRRTRSDSNSPIQQEHHEPNICTPRTTWEPKNAKRTPASDYGDFDDDDLDEASLLTCIPSKQEQPLLSNPKESNLYSLPKPHSPRQLTKSYICDMKQVASQTRSLDESESTQQTKNKDDDEFDDSDEDLFAAGLDDMVASFGKCNKLKTTLVDSMTPADTSVPQKRPLVVEDSDDEFGDEDLDIGDFQVAELAATQCIQQTTHSALPVRTKYP